MSDFVICDFGLLEASLVPSECFQAPGLCPPGIYRTLLWKPGAGICRPLGIHRFRSQVRQCHDPAAATKIPDLAQIAELITADNLTQSRTRVRLMAFDQPIALSDHRTTSTVAFAAPAPEPVYSEHFRCAIAPRHRLAGNHDWNIKRLARAQVDADLETASANGVDDVLYLDALDRWCEASYSNIIAVFGNNVVSMEETLRFSGDTELLVRDIAAESGGLKATTQALGRRELAAADEVFLTSSIRGLQPVTEIEGIGTWPLDPPNSVRRRIYREMNDRGLV